MSELISKDNLYLLEFSKCSKCNHNNPPYQSICENCKSYLRDKIVNIDLWATTIKLIEHPLDAFRKIVFAEHKNFIFFLLFFIGIKNLLLARFISVPRLGLDGVTSPLSLIILLSFLFTISFSTLVSLIQARIFQKLNINIRVIDYLALNSFSQIPLIFSLVFIFPVELVVLGSDVFSNNPYSFQIKPTITYILISIEVLMIVWTFILYYFSIRLAGLKMLVSISLTLSYFFIWVSILYVMSQVIFGL